MSDIAVERWRPVLNHPEYEVSDHGRVRTVAHVVERAHGVPMSVSSRILRQRLSKGRPCVDLYATGSRRTRLVAQLVAEAFVSGDRGPVVRHRDDIATNNHWTNLEWGTRSDNAHDAVRNGRHANASKSHCKHGHPFDPANTYVNPKLPTQRYCRACMRDRRLARAKAPASV